MPNADTVVIFDFETTGLSPDMGDRAIEIGAVKIERGEIVDRFQALMNPGQRVSPFIADYTGITNDMLQSADTNAQVMHRFADFVDGYNLIAHNASFDKRFLEAELALINRQFTGEYGCSLLVARRIYQEAPSHKLGELIKFTHIESEGNFHRALFDSEMTCKLWLLMLDELKTKANVGSVPFALITTLAKTPKKSVGRLLAQYNA